MTRQTSPRGSRDAVPSRQPEPTRACSAGLMTPILHTDRPARSPPAHKRPLFGSLHPWPPVLASPRPGRKQAACPASVDPCQALCRPALMLSCGKCWRGHERGLWCHTRGGCSSRPHTSCTNLGLLLTTLSPPVAQTVKNVLAMRETRVPSPGWEDPLEEEMATHSSVLAWEIAWREEPGGLQSMGSQRVGHN